ncbi:hypothetical protein VTL71DRAFT_6861 [Oculimacula yallundae]|uniref:FAD-binding domain-containing protein n=1 Tax=Oculimacula yallundae TaxID=86028 RepID=A0ABR4BV15_9HELO
MAAIDFKDGSKSKPKFLIIGAGFGGLTAAIELKRKGVEVLVIEAAPEFALQGWDIIQIPSNATRIITKWGNLLGDLEAHSSRPSTMTIFRSSGEEILKSPLPAQFGGFPILFSSRCWAHLAMYKYAQSIGVQFRLGTRIADYFEDDNCAGVYIGAGESQELITANGVLCADGIHSKGRWYITGKEEVPRTSGFAVYRAWFPLEVLGLSEKTEKFTKIKEDLFYVWLHEDVHATFMIDVALRKVTVFCTHKDRYEVEESWSFKGDLKEMLEVVDGWDETIRAVISAIPPEVLVDWKLLWRDPIRKWVSDKGRVVLIGDAAHPHLPNSGSGAAQAIEDGATIGVILSKLGDTNVPLAFRSFEKLRYERTSLTQRLGWETRHRWHQTDWEFVKSNPEFLKMPMPGWLYGSDAEQYAFNRLEEVMESIKTGSPFKSTNIPDGHVHEDWTVETMMALEHKQVQAQFYKIVDTK